ncbi:MAG: MFS transporter [Oscillospiraceae bacterium]|nr:MFS transporter [Oscillospiraceae bacterium]MBR0451044.1 MFS transporter [Oscillospiraceae bacterium]
MFGRKLLGYSEKITLLFVLTYFASYLTRVNFAAIISGIEDATGYSKASLSLCVTGLFICYGIGQIVSGYLGDVLRPKPLVFMGLLSSSICNLLMPVCRSTFSMVFLWSINGFAQAFLWPPIVLLLTVILDEHKYRDAVMAVNTGGSIGSVFIYLISPMLMMFFSWKSVFVFSGIIGLIMSILWMRYCPSVSTTVSNPQKKPLRDAEGKSLFPVEMYLILLAIVLQGALRDGASTWMPSNIEETFHLNGKLSILSGAVLPMFSTIGYKAALQIHTRWLRNPVKCASLLFVLGSVTAAALTIFSDINAFLSVFLFTLLSGLMHGINLMLVSLLPSYFGRMGVVSTVSGLVNSCTYLGSALFTYGVGASVDYIGWEWVTGIWCAIACLGALTCYFSSGTEWCRKWFGR